MLANMFPRCSRRTDAKRVSFKQQPKGSDGSKTRGLSLVSVVLDTMPAVWREKTDPKSGRSYWINR
jgi:hypothetical protein